MKFTYCAHCGKELNEKEKDRNYYVHAGCLTLRAIAKREEDERE